MLEKKTLWDSAIANWEARADKPTISHALETKVKDMYRVRPMLNPSA